MKTVKAGTAIINGINGADWSLKYDKKLPGYYITKEKIIANGWRQGKSVSDYTDGKMVFGGRYYNSNNHLPQTHNRIWYEADINYVSGKRNSQRILFSDDGLIFVTFDHYQTFFEIV